MPRVLLCVTVLGLFAALSRADEKGTTPETLIRLDVSPAAAPEPALRYMLLPELREMSPGNPIFNYLQVLHGAAELPLRQGGVPASRRAAGHAAQGASRAGAGRNTAGRR